MSFFLLFSNLSQLCIEMVFHCPLFGQTVCAHLAEERFVWQTRCWRKMWPLTRKRTLTDIRSTAKRTASERMKNGWPSRLKRFPWTAERPKKNFERLAVNGWTAKEKFRTACGERLNGQRKISNGLRWTAERPKKNFERLAVNGWTARKNLQTARGERVNGHQKISNGWLWTAERLLSVQITLSFERRRRRRREITRREKTFNW